MSGTIGDSTRARLAGVVRAANAGGGGGDGRAGGQYVGGYGGGLGGTWGKAPTNRGDAAVPTPGAGGGAPAGGPPPRPASAGRMRPPSAGTSAPAFGAPGGAGAGTGAGDGRKVRPSSGAAKNLWDELPKRDLPRAPPHGMTSSKPIRPASATFAGGRVTRPLSGVGMDLKSPGTGYMEPLGTGGGGGGGGYGGRGGGHAFGGGGGPPGSSQPMGSMVTYDTGPMPMGRAAAAQMAAGQDGYRQAPQP